MKLKFHHKLKPLIIIAVCFVAIGLIATKVNMGFNQSPSLPGRGFLIVKGTLPKERFGIASFKSVSELTEIKKNGSKYPITRNSKVKHVVGFEGDVISVKRNVENGINCIFINSKDFGRIKTFSLKGEKLPPIVDEGQSITIPKDCYFVWTPHKDSDD